VSQNLSEQLSEILQARRAQVRFRVTIGLAIALFFGHLLGVVPMMLWTAAYCGLQALEMRLFPRSSLPLARNDANAARLVLLLFFLNSAVFGSASVLWALSVGSWGLACGGYLLAGAMLNVVLTTPGSRTAFGVSIAPYLAYLMGAPLLAMLQGAELGVALNLGLAGALMAVCALKLWSSSNATRASETAARARLAEREAEANHDRAFLDTIVENVPAMLVVKSIEEGRFVRLNAAGEALLGVSRSDFLGKTDYDLFPAEQADGFVAADRRVVESGESVVIACEAIQTATGERQLKTKKVVIDGGQGDRFLLAIAEDITEQRATELALQSALERAEAANLAKSTFLATMSHEIRTPLNGVLGMAQAMAGDDLPDEQARRVAVIQQSGEALLAILNDVLDISKIEAGKLELESIEFDMGDLAQGLSAAFVDLAEAKGLSFGLELDACAGRYLGDPTRLRQILFNLVSNAVKFTETGRIEVVFRYGGAELVVAVTDTGIGMSQATTSRLFGSFNQADASTTRRFGGTGLGLAISRNLAEMMGGRIAVESAPDTGSCFTLSLPLTRLAVGASQGETPPGDDVQAEALQLKVLAAEDNPLNRLVLATLLGQIGVVPAFVENGREAVEALEREGFDLVLMDVQMPEMDGPTATRLIRRREAETGRPRTPIVALTANVLSHQVAEYQACGMDAYVAKPIEVGALFKAMMAVTCEDAPELAPPTESLTA
jgi:PAS domain S-box-containing protein